VGRKMENWKGAYSLIPREAQKNDPFSEEFDAIRLDSTRRDGYHHRLYVIFSRDRHTDGDVEYRSLKSKDERLGWIVANDCNPRKSLVHLLLYNTLESTCVTHMAFKSSNLVFKYIYIYINMFISNFSSQTWSLEDTCLTAAGIFSGHLTGVSRK
jgi:hypothetical protein